MITNFFIPEFNNHDVQELWFQQDGATYHTARATIDLLKDTFGDRLISRFGPVNWPPRSCDLTPLDNFLWGYVKSLVYADKPQTLDHLEDYIRRVIADIRPQMLEKVIENWMSRLDYIRASRGSPMSEIIFKIGSGLSLDPNALYQKNNARPHAARHVLTFLDTLSIQLLAWLVRFPHLLLYGLWLYRDWFVTPLTVIQLLKCRRDLRQHVMSCPFVSSKPSSTPCFIGIVNRKTSGLIHTTNILLFKQFIKNVSFVWQRIAVHKNIICAHMNNLTLASRIFLSNMWCIILSGEQLSIILSGEQLIVDICSGTAVQ
ncbi:uncharacterized protein TNCV_4259841 [Trichonephila clavipes]|nr:uncharacterized protein TNCV_4259841 [Trichonephila clavipes]